MKKFLALSMLALLLTSCGGRGDDKDSDLLNGILDSNGSRDSLSEEDYEIPTSEGPSMLPPADEDLTEETDE